MDFSISEDCQSVHELAAQILKDACPHEHLRALEDDPSGDGYDHELWARLAEANLLGVGMPEAYGGSDMGLSALYGLLEEAGRTLAPVPLLPALVYAALPIAEFGSARQKARWLPGLASGTIGLSAALQEVGSSRITRPRTTATPEAGGWILDGEKVCVPAARWAERILVLARSGEAGCGAFLVDPKSAGVELEDATSYNHERQFRMRLCGVRAGAEDVLGDGSDGLAIAQWLEQRAQLALCAMQLGVTEEALRRTAEYTTSRKQFGRPIASFQAVSMRAADAYIDLEAMRSTYWQATFRLESGMPAAQEIAAAKWWACRGGQRVVHAAQHLHGGIGADVDYPIHRYFLWARQLETTLGAASIQLERLGELIAQGASNP